MFLRIFNNKSFGSVLFVPIVAFLFWMEPLQVPVALANVPGEGMMPLFQLVSGWFTGISVAPTIAGFVLVVLNALVLSLLSYEYQFLQHRTFLPGILYVSVVSSFTSLQQFHPAHIAALFVLLSVYYIFRTYHRKNEVASTFNASFFLSVGVLFYFPVVTLYPLIWISIFVLQKSDNWRLLISPLIGILLPWLLTWTFLFLAGADQMHVSTVLQGLNVINNRFITSLAFLVISVFIFMLSAMGSIALFNSVTIRRMSTRKYFIILYWMTALSVPSVFLFTSTGLGVIAIATLPVSFLMTHFFMTGKRRFWKELFFLIFMAALVAGHFLLFD